MRHSGVGPVISVWRILPGLSDAHSSLKHYCSGSWLTQAGWPFWSQVWGLLLTSYQLTWEEAWAYARSIHLALVPDSPLLADRKWYGWACWSSRNTRGHPLVAAFTHVDTRASTLRHSTIVCRNDKPAPLGCMLTWNTFSYPYLPSVSLLWRDVYLNLWSIF